MNVKDLIELLEQMPQDAQVIFSGVEGYEPVALIELEDGVVEIK